jgi:hypothetical protein
MSPGVTKPVLVLAALYLGILACPAAGQGSNNQAGFVNSGQTATLDCLGGKAEIVGGDNVLAIKGKCSNLDLAGSGNKITIEFGPAAKVSILGSNNAIVWTSVDGKPPTINYVGSGNAVTPQGQ